MFLSSVQICASYLLFIFCVSMTKYKIHWLLYEISIEYWWFTRIVCPFYNLYLLLLYLCYLYIQRHCNQNSFYLWGRKKLCICKMFLFEFYANKIYVNCTPFTPLYLRTVWWLKLQYKLCNFYVLCRIHKNNICSCNTAYIIQQWPKDIVIINSWIRTTRV